MASLRRKMSAKPWGLCGRLSTKCFLCFKSKNKIKNKTKNKTRNLKGNKSRMKMRVSRLRVIINYQLNRLKVDLVSIALFWRF